MPNLTKNNFDPNADIPDLSGKVYIVTGGSAGIGFGIVAHLVQHNALKVIILSNKKQHAEEAMEELKEFGDTSKVHWVHCDLSDLRQTDETAKTLALEEKQVDALICNAGLGVGKYWETTDGLDSHMQVNFFAQAHLFFTLLPNLQSTPHARLVLQSSDLHRAAPPSAKFASLDEINRDIGASLLYNRSKLAQVLFVRALTRRMQKGELGFNKENILYANASHPGAVNTDQQEQAVEAYGTLGKIGVKATRPFMADPVKTGCKSALWAATSNEVIDEGVTGEYVVPEKKVASPSSQAQDVQLQENLWGLTVKVLKEKLGAGYKVEL